MSKTPTRNEFLRLKDLDIATVNNNRWTYSERFLSNFKDFAKKPVNPIKQRGLATTLLSLIKNDRRFRRHRSKHKVNKLATAYLSLEHHLNKERLSRPSDFNSILYATLYLNDNEPNAGAS